MKTWMAGLLCMLASGAALATGWAAANKRAEDGMLIRGTIAVAPDGSVAKFSIEQDDKLPPAVREMLAKAIPAWKFAPVAVGSAQGEAQAPMGLRVVAQPVGKGSYKIGVVSAWFGQVAGNPAETISFRHEVAPGFPMNAARAGVTGTVYALVQIGPDGKVLDAVAAQVDLRILASDEQLAAWRKVFADYTVDALRKDSFNVPSSGPQAGKPYWVAGVQVSYYLLGSYVPASAREPLYGHWQTYVPGPLHKPAWVQDPQLASSANAMPAGGIRVASTQLHLLTPLTM